MWVFGWLFLQCLATPSLADVTFATAPLHRHQRRELASTPAWGSVWPTAIYWCFIELGTPPSRFPVAIDSGSPFLAVAGRSCQGCVTKSPNGAYDSTMSSSSRPYRTPVVQTNQTMWREVPPRTSDDTSTFLFSYQTCDLKAPTEPCSIGGSFYQEKVSLAGLGPVDIVVGSIENQTTNFDQFKEIDGVMGILPPWKGFEDRNVFSQLVSAGLSANVWAMCIHEGVVGTGTLTIGGVDERLYQGPMRYAQNLGQSNPDMGFYAVQVNGLRMGKASVSYHGAALLDTGTNVQLLPTALLSAVRSALCSDALLSHCEALFDGHCFNMTQTQVDSYPPFALDLDGFTIEMTSQDYLLRGSPLASAESEYCMGLKEGGKTGGSGFIIGDTMMRNYYVVYDLEHKQIGWGKVNKAMCGSVNDDDRLSILTVFV